MISVVIPAHNEAQQIEGCLSTLLADAEPGEIEIVVVCNGCRDGTARAARRFGADVQVLELPTASKAAALNAGDRRATAFPRVYLDADTKLPTSALRALGGTLADGPPVAYPRVRADLVGAPLGVRLFYRMWSELCYERRDFVGAGVYALSREGRHRFEEFPSTVADDFFVRRLFGRHEAAVPRGAQSTIQPPGSIRQLVQVKTRVFCRNAACERLYGDRLKPDGDRPSFLRVAWRTGLWPAAAVYARVIAEAKLRAKWRMRFGDPEAWSRDETTRGGGEAATLQGQAVS